MQNSTSDKDKKILIVDDDYSVRSFLEIFLKRKGYLDVQTAENGADALKIVEKEDIKLVFLDVRLPGMDGIEVLHRITAVKKDIAVIMITGYPEESVAKEAIAAGAYDYIIKPFDLPYLEMSMLSKMALMNI